MDSFSNLITWSGIIYRFVRKKWTTEKDSNRKENKVNSRSGSKTSRGASLHHISLGTSVKLLADELRTGSSSRPQNPEVYNSEWEGREWGNATIDGTGGSPYCHKPISAVQAIRRTETGANLPELRAKVMAEQRPDFPPELNLFFMPGQHKWNTKSKDWLTCETTAVHS